MVPSAPADVLVTGAVQPERLLALCPALATASSLCVAYSGGLDSTVLLHLLWQAREAGRLTLPLRALHVHHGLQPQADHWLQQCRQQCLQWNIPFISQHISVALAGEGVEAAARRARYQAFASVLLPDEILVQAHHADDQAETLLLRLLRGSGPGGLAGMPVHRTLAAGRLLRPLLLLQRQQLQAYAGQHDLHWQEDPSNNDSRYDRNYLRTAILPLLQQRWPHATEALVRSAGLMQEAAGLLAALATQDLVAAGTTFPNRLSVQALQQLDHARQRNLLQHWLQQQSAALQVPVPAFQLLHRCVAELIAPQTTGHLMLAWGEAELARELHRYRDVLYLIKPMPVLPPTCVWDTAQPLPLPEPLGSLHWQAAEPAGLVLQVKFRSGGERVCKPDGHHQSFKDYCQQRQVPPWLRDRIPLLYHGQELVAIGDEVLPRTSLALQSKNTRPLYWQRSLLLCGW